MATFTKVTPGALTAGSGTLAAPTTDTWTIAVVELSQNSRRYRDFVTPALVGSQTKLLLTVPETYGEIPALGSSVELPDGFTYTVRDIRTLSPDGVAILSYLVVSR